MTNKRKVSQLPVVLVDVPLPKPVAIEVTLRAGIFTDPDLVDRIFEYLLAEFPHIAGDRFLDAKRAVRDEFKGQKVWVAARPATERQRLVDEVLSMFDGRNATEVARRLDISRPTVYRMLKQAGRRK